MLAAALTVWCMYVCVAAKVAKTRQLADVGVGPAAAHLSDDDYEQHIEELKRAANERNPSVTHVKQLLRESYANRREWMRNLAMLDVQNILEKFPCLQQGKYVSYDLRNNIIIY